MQMHIDRNSRGELEFGTNGGYMPSYEEVCQIVEYFNGWGAKWTQEKIDQHNKETDAFWAERERRDRESRPSEPKPIPVGYIYILTSEKLHKIGRSKDPERRMKELAKQNPYPLKLLFLAKIKDYIVIEEELLEMFVSKQEHGEWFRLDESDFDTIRDFILARGGELVDVQSLN